MLERALTQPQQSSVDPLTNAYSWGIPIWSTYELQNWLEKISANLLKESNSLKRESSGKQVKVKRFNQPYIKFESYCRKTRPVFLELQTWPTLNFDGDPGSCPFDLNKREKKENLIVSKNIQGNKEKSLNFNTSKGKDMTRRPRATATRARKTENTGYCEICRVDYRNLSKHLQSDQHRNFIRDDKNFLSLDNLINTGASVEAFLKINRPKDGKDSILSSRDHSLDNGIRTSNENTEKREKFDENDFDIDDVKMVHCNGARRNLNSRLDTAHNLRTRVTKHESGHSLRSKGKTEEGQEKSERSLERFTITKRAKGTLWIEEDSSEDDKDSEKEHVDFNGRPLSDPLCNPEIKKRLDSRDCSSENISMNGDIDSRSSCKRKENSSKNALRESFLDSNLKTKINGYEKRERKLKDPVQGAENKTKEIKIKQEIIETHDNGDVLLPYDNEDSNSLKSLGRRGAKPMRSRQRLSVEERLIEDNKDYYKVEVLGSKLRSSAIPPGCNHFMSSSREPNDRSPKNDDKSSSEKIIGMRFKRVRKSELSLLSDEAETFMFGEPRRDDSSSESDAEHSSVLPKDTESSDRDGDSQPLESSPAAKLEANDDELSQDSSASARAARKRRRTHTEVLLKDNSDYYKFETPGSRLRYQAPLTGVSDFPTQSLEPNAEEAPPKIYPSKPSAEVEQMHYSFEAVPKSESWYQTYQRQDEGEEYYYYSEVDRKPFLLPYEIENFHEILQKSIQSSSIHRKRGGRRGGGRGNVGSRSPRKSPRCHASTLAIMSTIIKRREQPSNLAPIEEEQPAVKSSKPTSSDTAKSEKKSHEKSDVDEDLKEIVKNIDEMLSCDDDEMDELNSFEVDLIKNPDEIVEPKSEPSGPPEDLLDLLDNCHDLPPNGVDNSSCASSDCGENSEYPAKRRKKKRKNKTGWPGNKMRRKLHIKNLGDELQRELEKTQESKPEENVDVPKTETAELAEEDSSNASQEEIETENETGKENEQVLNKIVCKKKNGRRSKSGESKECNESADETESKNALKSIISKTKVEEEENEFRDGKETMHLKETLSSISEDSEESLSNNENFCTQGGNSAEKSPTGKFVRTQKNTTSSEASQNAETEINSGQRGSPESSPKHLKESSDSPELQQKNPSNNNNGRAKKGLGRPPKNKLNSSSSSSSNSNSNRGIQTPPTSCSQSSRESFLVENEKQRLKKVRRNSSVSSELLNGDIDAVQASPVASSDVDQRRSSIDFQPVVRVTKIEDQVDIDSNSVISVAVASNRRLRSSSSPRSSMQPPKKRSKTNQRKRLKIS